MKTKLLALVCVALLMSITVPNMIFAATPLQPLSHSNDIVAIGDSGLSFVIGSIYYTSNGEQKTMDVAPYTKGGRTYLPVRYVGEALGAEVGWEDSTSSVTLTKGNIVIALRIGSRAMTVNGQTSNMDAAPELTGGRTCLPIRFVAEALGQTVGWDPNTNAVIITKDAASQPTLGMWFTPNYQDEFCEAVMAFTEGYFVGYRPPAIVSETYNVAIYKDTMELVTVTKYTTSRGAFSDGLMAVGFEGRWDVDDSLGYMDTAGNEVIPLKYYWASPFKNGLAVVMQRDGDKVTTKVINKNDEVQFEFAGEYPGYVYEEGIYFDEKGSYDYQGNPGHVSSATTVGKHVYYNDGERIVVTGYDGSEAAAFKAQYGELYGWVDYLGHGLFRVGHISAKPVSAEEMDWDVYDAQKKNINGVVNKQNEVIIPMEEKNDITPHYTESSVFFTVNMSLDDETRGVVYNAAGQKILNNGTFRVWYAGVNAIYYAKPGNKGWGLMSLTGSPIVPYSKSFLSYIDDRGFLGSDNDFFIAPPSRITFYTTTNMQQKADTTRLRALVAEASEIAKKLSNIPDTGEVRTRLARAITSANKVLSSQNPIWVDVSAVEVRLLYIANMAHNAVAGQ